LTLKSFGLPVGNLCMIMSLSNIPGENVRPALLKLPARQKTSMPNIVDYQ